MSVSNRARRLVAVRGEVIAVALVLVAVVAFAGAWMAYTNPPTEVVTEQRNPETVAVATNTTAAVTGDSPLYERGARLDDMPVYFFSASPEFALSVTTSLPAGQPVTVTERLVVHMRGTRDGEAFWEETRVLAATEETVRDGNVVLGTTVNMSDLRTDVRLHESAVGGVGTFSAVLRLTVDYETAHYDDELVLSAPLVFSDDAYWLGEDLAERRTHTQTVRHEVQRPPDATTVGALGGGGVLSLLGAALVVLARRDGPDPDALVTEVVHERYEEWISTGEFPTGTQKKYVHIETLEDLVDIAIDSNKRVVFDPEFAAYAVADGDLIYYYSDDRRRIDSWLDV